MLPPFIIEQIRQREESERLRREVERPRLELPLPLSSPPDSGDSPKGERHREESERGVVILDLC